MPLTVERVALFVAEVFRPLPGRLDAVGAAQLLSELGLPAADVVAEHPRVADATGDIVATVSLLTPLLPELAEAIERGDVPDVAALAEEVAGLTGDLLDAIADLADAIDAVADEAGGGGPAVRRFAAELLQRLLGYLISVHLERRAPLVHDLAELVGLVELTDVPAGAVVPAHLRREARFDRLGQLLDDPAGVLGDLYGWGTQELDWALLSRRLLYLLAATGFASIEEGPDDETPALRIALVDIAPAAREGPPGLAATTRAQVAAGTSVAGHIGSGVAWEAATEGELEQATALQLSPPATVRVVPPTAELDGRLSIGIRVERPDRSRTALLGALAGSRIEADSVRASAGVELDWQADGGEAVGDLVLSASIAGGRVVLDPSGADGFLQSLLPGEGFGVDLDADVEFAWSSARGLHVKGAPGPVARYPVDLHVGPVRVVALDIGLDVSADRLAVATLTSATARLGPLAVTIEGIGAETALSFPHEGGSLGTADLDVRFRPPAGLAVSVNADPVRGGGFLIFDADEERYAGAVQLDVGGLALNAVGLLTTRVPESGYSLLVLVSGADLPPVNLGFGFTLNAVGGLLGVNRAADVDELRTRLRGGGLDAIALPDDPLDSAGEMVDRLRSTFPTTPGRHVVGPAALIGWGTPTMLTIELVVALELPEPVRLVALAQLRARLPSEDRTLVRLNMDALGVVDFDRGRAALDARLYDSHIAGHAVEGDVALRARWSGDPDLVLAAGGLNPRYQPPKDLPELDRLSMRLARRGARLRLEVYLALTSNTVQLGARLGLEVGVGRFTIDGRLQFDTLFERSPFGFVADFAAEVGVRWGDRSMLGVRLEMTLSGPAPLHARGQATFEIWRFLHSVSFDVELDRGDPPDPAPPADPVPELLGELEGPRSWSAPPPRDAGLVALGDPDRPDLALLHPLGQLTVRQRVLPLEVEVARFGGTRLQDGPRVFTLAVSLPEGTPVEARTVTDHFAPGQFLDLDRHDALSAPAFERLPSGVRLEIPDAQFGGQDDAGLATTAPVGHDTRVVDGGVVHDAADAPLSDKALRRAAARVRATRAGRGRHRGPDLKVRAREPVYVVARADDLRVESFTASGGADGLSHTAATQLLHRLRRRDDAPDLQVVVRHEAVGALPGLLPPGASPEEPGEYEERGSFGARVPGARRVTMLPDSDPLPPTQAPRRRWQWVAPLEDAQ